MSLFKRIKFWNEVDRLGPDIPTTHWKLYFKSTMRRICKEMFYYFSDSAEIRPGAYIVGCSKISIGKKVIIRPGTMLFGVSSNLDLSIEIQDNVMLGSGCHIYVANHNFKNPNLPIIDQGHDLSNKVLIKNGAWIGANVIILPGVEIGENSVIGAGSIVTKNIQPYCVAAGNPAKTIKRIK